MPFPVASDVATSVPALVIASPASPPSIATALAVDVDVADAPAPPIPVTDAATDVVVESARVSMYPSLAIESCAPPP